VTGVAYLLLGAGALILLLVGVAGCLWLVQVILNAHEAGQKSS
jgi:hypothetical protein